jgi:hypothetical protein
LFRRHLKSITNVLLPIFIMNWESMDRLQMGFPFIFFNSRILGCKEPIWIEPETTLFDLIDAQGRERKLSIFQPLDPSLFFQIPDMEFHKVDGDAHEAGRLHFTEPRIIHLASTLHVIEG